MIIAEAKYDSATTEISRAIISRFKKGLTDYVRSGIRFSVPVPSALNSFLDDIKVGVSYTEYGTPYRIEGEYSDRVLLINMELTYPDVKSALGSISSWMGELKNVIRHELEHTEQDFYGELDDSVEGDSDLDSLLNYYFDPIEVSAHAAGIYKQAKTERVPVTGIIDKFIDRFEEDLLLTADISDNELIRYKDNVRLELENEIKRRYPSAIFKNEARERRLKITESRLRLHIRNTLMLFEKRWVDFNAPKGQVINLQPEDFDEDKCLEEPCPPEVRDLDDEIFDLIQTAYADVSLGGGRFGNIKVQSPSDLPAGYTIMKAVDLDDDPEPDVFRGGKMRGGRYKMGISGHDGSTAAVQRYLEMSAEALLDGAIAEMSGKIATIMITRYGVPAITDHDQVESMLGKPVDWVGRHPVEKWAQKYGPGYEGFYCRDISGACSGEHMKILLGGA